MEKKKGFDSRVDKINVPEPVCYLRWGEDGGYGMTMAVHRDFNWFQKKMLKWCFGLVYSKNGRK